MNRSVMIDGRLIGYRYGGIAKYAAALAKYLPRIAPDLNIRLAISRATRNHSDRAVQVFTPPHHRLERWLFGLEVAIHRPRLLHSVDFIQPATRGTPNVITVHDLAFLMNPELVTNESRRHYSRIVELGPLADRVIVVSESTRRQLLAHVDIEPERVRLIPNGYDPDCFNVDGANDADLLAHLHPALGTVISSERPIVLTVGTLEPRKRQEILLQAFDAHYETIARSSGSSPILVVAGQVGWLSGSIVSHLRSLHRRSRVLWLPDVRDRELAALYRTASLHTMASADEGFGLPVLEAMACGTTSLVSNAGALPELVKDCGFIEESADPQNWADKIGRILSDREIRERRKIRGIDRAQHFTWESTARETASVYREVLREQ